MNGAKRGKISTKPKPKRGDIWLIRFPFTDLTSAKVRPDLILAVHGEDIVVIGIFSRLPIGELRETWVPIKEDHSEYFRIGLKKTSVLKAEKIAVVHESVLQRSLGNLPQDIMEQVKKAVKKALLMTD